MMPRLHFITSHLAYIQNNITSAKAYGVGVERALKLDTENYEHLTGKPLDKTAGRNTLGLRNGK